MIFDWDESKGKANIKNHDGVTFEEASVAVLDYFALEEYDDKHSTSDEKRYACIGVAGTRVLYVVYTVLDENTDNEICRIISARLAEPKEITSYEREKFKSGYFG